MVWKPASGIQPHSNCFMNNHRDDFRAQKGTVPPILNCEGSVVTIGILGIEKNTELSNIKTYTVQCFTQTYPKSSTIWTPLERPSDSLPIFTSKKKNTHKRRDLGAILSLLYNVGWFKTSQTFVSRLVVINNCLVILMQPVCTFWWPRAHRFWSRFFPTDLTKPFPAPGWWSALTCALFNLICSSFVKAT